MTRRRVDRPAGFVKGDRVVARWDFQVMYSGEPVYYEQGEWLTVHSTKDGGVCLIRADGTLITSPRGKPIIFEPDSFRPAELEDLRY
jgi:hypothetical protein